MIRTHGSVRGRELMAPSYSIKRMEPKEYRRSKIINANLIRYTVTGMAATNKKALPITREGF